MSQQNKEGDRIENTEDDHIKKEYHCCTSLGRDLSCYIGILVFLSCALSLVSSILGGIIWINYGETYF